jgi:DNA-binding transcriptional ArsR family regulator
LNTVSTGKKTALLQQFARIGKAIAAPQRLELLDVLGHAPRTVEAIARLTGLSVANASQHLQVLRAAGLVEATKEGLFVSYRLASPRVGDFLEELRALAAERLADVERAKRDYLGAPEPQVEVTGQELLRRVKRGEVVLIDVRPAEEYAAAHLPGALSVPIDELQERLSELPRSKEIVSYSRGPY